MNPDLFQSLLTKKMTRREFLAYLGVLALAISGISGVLERLHHTQKVVKPRQAKTGFGNGAYGA